MRNAHPHTAKIRRRRIIYFELGLILALSSLLWAFNLNFEPGIDLVPKEVDPFDKEFDSLIIINIEEEVAKQEALKNEPAPRPSDQLNIVDDHKAILEPVQEPIDKLGNSDDYDKLIANLLVQVGPDDIEDNTVINVAQVSPQYPGGTEAMMLFIRKNVKYPPLAKENGVQGRAVVSFIVEKDGTLSHFTIEKNPGWGLGEEALLVLKSMPRWSPGEQNFRPVRVRMMIPIVFKLD